MSDARPAGERIEQLLDALGTGGPLARQRAEELVRVVVDLYGAGLERLLEIAGPDLPESTVDALAADELVSGLLVVHGLHPYALSERVERALESVRPYLRSHGGDVELLGVDDGPQGRTVGLRLLGHCDGCAGSTATLRSRRGGSDRGGGAGGGPHRGRRAHRTGTPGTAHPGGRAHGPDQGMTRPDGARRPAPDPERSAAGAGGRAVRDVRPAGRRRPSARGRRGQPGAVVHLPAVLAAVRLPGRPAGVQGGAGPLPGRRATAACRCGRTCRSRWTSRSSSPTPGSAGWWASTRARPGRPSPSCRSAPGTRSSRSSRCSARSRTTSRRRWCGCAAARVEAYLVPIDVCYELVGQLRRLWRGFDGGREVRVALDEFFAAGRRGGAGDRARVRPSSTSRRSRTRAAPTLLFRVRLDESTGARCTRPCCGRRSRSSRSGAATATPSGTG